MWCEININDTIKFKPTEVGIAAYERSWRDLRLNPPALKRDADGWVSMQLWEVMHYFGGECGSGRPVPIETKIQIEIVD